MSESGSANRLSQPRGRKSHRGPLGNLLSSRLQRRPLKFTHHNLDKLLRTKQGALCAGRWQHERAWGRLSSKLRCACIVARRFVLRNDDPLPCLIGSFSALWHRNPCCFVAQKLRTRMALRGLLELLTASKLVVFLFFTNEVLASDCITRPRRPTKEHTYSSKQQTRCFGSKQHAKKQRQQKKLH